MTKKEIVINLVKSLNEKEHESFFEQLIVIIRHHIRKW